MRVCVCVCATGTHLLAGWHHVGGHRFDFRRHVLWSGGREQNQPLWQVRALLRLAVLQAIHVRMARAPHAAHLSLPPFVTTLFDCMACASCVCGDRWMVDVKEQADSVPKWDIRTGEALCFYLAEAYNTKYASLPQLPHPHHCAHRLRPPPQHQPSRAHPPCPSHPSSRCARTQGGARQAHCHLLLLPRHGPHHHVLDSKRRR
jgi:hypothetical protein